jgi:hypothetical protein
MLWDVDNFYNFIDLREPMNLRSVILRLEAGTTLIEQVRSRLQTFGISRKNRSLHLSRMEDWKLLVEWADSQWVGMLNIIDELISAGS